MAMTTRELLQTSPEEKIVKTFLSEVKAAEGAGRQCRFTITTDDVDRENDVISADGWETADFLAAKGPVLWAHDYRQPPIGRTLALTHTPHGMSADVEFADAETYAFADTIYRLIKGGFLSATSVGFKSLEWTWDEERGGINFLRQSLLEFSCVPVPANPHCLIEARGAGIDVEPLREWAAKTIEYLTEQKRVPAEIPVAPGFDVLALKRQVDEACNSVSRFTVLVQGLSETLAAKKEVESPVVPLIEEDKAPEAASEVSGDVPKAPATGGDTPNQDSGAVTEDSFDIIPDDDADVELSVDDVRTAMIEALKETVGTAMNKRLGRVD